MGFKHTIFTLVFSVSFLSLFAQKSDNGPSFVGKVSSLEYVAPLSERPGDLLPVDKTFREAKDKRSLGNFVRMDKSKQQEDDYFVKNRHPKEQSRPGRMPSVVFDAYTSNSQPTDPSLAVGPNHVFVVFNTGFAIYDKQGNELVGETSPNPAIFPSGGCCDLTVTYDFDADRWVLSFLGGGAQIAVSDGPDPVNDGWFVYTINAINDYQKLSMWSDGYYMTDNTNSSNKVWALERDLMLVGDPNAQIISFDLPDLATFGFFSPQALNVANGPLPATGGLPIIYLQDDGWGNAVNEDHIKLWTVDVDWTNTANSTISDPEEIITTPFNNVFDNGSFSNLSQPNGGPAVDALQATVMNQAQFRKFDTHNSAVFNFVVDTDGGNGELAGIRWYEFRQDGDNMPWSIYQEGTYTAPDGRHAWMGGMSIDGEGNIALGYTSMSGPSSSGTTFISSYYTGRQASDPLNTMTQVEELVAEGTGNIPGTRYGDYGKMDIDPSDDATFWFINEYVNGVRSGVVGAFTLEPPIPDDENPTDPTNLQASNITDSSVTLTWTASTDNVGVVFYNILIDGVQIGTINGTSADVTGLLPLTTYTATVTAQDAAGNVSGPAEVTFTTLDPPPPMYCESFSNNATEEYIIQVGVNTINNTSGSSNYTDFTSISTDLIEGETYTISITAEWPGTVFNEGYAVYIDYNNDIDFDDPGEMVVAIDPNTDEVNTASFTVPTGTSLASVRMRVSLMFNDIAEPCENFQWGEVEDYTVNLLSADDPCGIVDSNDGESGFGIWNDGGADAGLTNNPAFANSGNFSFQIKDNTSTSVITTDNLNLEMAEFAELDFNYITTGFDNTNHDFWLQVSTDGGATFTTVETYVFSIDFVNDVREFETAIVSGPFTPTTQFRFRCDANINNDRVFIDDIVINSCTGNGVATCDDGIQNGDETGIDCGGALCPACDPCTDVDFNDAEVGFGIWIDGGADAARTNNADVANSGNFSFQIKDNTNTSTITTNNLDLSSAAELNLDFNFITTGFNNTNHDFWLQISTDGGTTFTTVQAYVFSVDFVNDVREFETVTLTGPFSATTQLRFRCDAANNNDRVFIDDILIEECDAMTVTEGNISIARTHADNLKSFTEWSDSKITLFPNPAQNTLNVAIEEGVFEEISIFSTTGQVLHKHTDQRNQNFSVDVSQYVPGLYFVRFVSQNGLAITKRFTKN